MEKTPYEDFYYACMDTLNAYQMAVNEYQEEVDTLRQGLNDYKNSPILQDIYRKNLRRVRRRQENYRHRIVCLEDLFRRHGI